MSKLSQLIAVAYSKPPLSWTVSAFNWIARQCMGTATRRLATAAVAATLYTGLGVATGVPALIVFGAVTALVIVLAVPVERHLAQRRSASLNDLAVSLARNGMPAQAADLARVAEFWRQRADHLR